MFKIKDAIKFPIVVSKNVKFKSLRGKIYVKKDVETAMIKIGFGDVGIFDKTKSKTILQIDGKLIFRGKASIGHGSKLSIGKNGVLDIGDNFVITAESEIISHKKISIGENCLISWKVLIMDTDFHKIFDKNTNDLLNENKEIKIGPKNWIGCRSVILKGVKTLENTVIASNSTITREFSEKNIIIGGNPGKIIKKNIIWSV
jgi:acetyltransferase-like isoleucine patch superfamily enzyme